MKKLIFAIIFVVLMGGVQPKAASAAGNRLDAPFIRQMPELARGCEVTSLAMMLQDAGVNVGKMQLAKEVKKVPFKSNGFYGNPYEGFVGNIYTFSESGYGVYHGPIYDLANKYLPNRVVDLTGVNITEVYNSIDKGKPVWVITNSRFSKLPSSQFQTWNTRSGKVKITYREHSVLVVGYDSKYVYINDPLYHKKNRAVSRANFEASWIQMGRQAITYVSQSEANYNGAVNQGKKLAADTTIFNSVIYGGDIKKINGAYDAFTAKIKAYEKSVGKVSGASNRDALNNTYTKPAKIAVERVIYEVSQYRLLETANQQINSGALSNAEATLSKLGRLKVRAAAIKQAGGYPALPVKIERDLAHMEAEATGNILKGKTSLYNNAISKSLSEMHKQYDVFTGTITKTEAVIGNVYGSVNRDSLAKTYVTPAKAAKERTIYEISQYRLMLKAQQLIQAGDKAGAAGKMSQLDRLKTRAEAIKAAGNYAGLPAHVVSELLNLENSIKFQLN